MHGGQCWWLQDPSTGWTLRFQWIPEGAWHYRLEIIKGRAMGSEPALLAWRRELPAREARELWLEHVRRGWRPGQAQW